MTTLLVSLHSVFCAPNINKDPKPNRWLPSRKTPKKTNETEEIYINSK